MQIRINFFLQPPAASLLDGEARHFSGTKDMAGRSKDMAGRGKDMAGRSKDMAGRKKKNIVGKKDTPIYLLLWLEERYGGKPNI